MTSNCAFATPAILPLLALLTLSACDSAVPRAQERAPSHPTPAPMPVPLPPRAPAPVVRPPQPVPPMPMADWRDGPLAPGDWSWTARATGSTARFGLAGQLPVGLLQCDRSAGVVRIALPIDAAAPQNAAPRAATITTSTTSGSVSAVPETIDGLATLAIALPASYRLLDAMAFSRGRFKVEISGLAPVVLPSWSEVGRVVEDCRG